VALVDALRHLKKQGAFSDLPLLDFVAAVSVGKVDGRLLLDLDYEEDSKAEVDMNIVKTGRGRFVEIQGTAEQTPFSPEELQQLLDLAATGIEQAIALQRNALGEVILKTTRDSRS
jgi:ribonuclease PH